MVGKTFKGMTDELLAWQTRDLSRTSPASEPDGHAVLLRPELVVEIELDGAQRSTRYPGGVALRFARVLRYRPDKTAGRGRHDRRGARAARRLLSSRAAAGTDVARVTEGATVVICAPLKRRRAMTRMRRQRADA